MIKVNGQTAGIRVFNNVERHYLGQLIDRVNSSTNAITSSGCDGSFYDYLAFNGISPSDLRNPDNCWSAPQDEQHPWIQYNFPATKTYWFNKIAIKCFSNYDSAWVGDIKVQGSLDGLTWENLLIGGDTVEITAPLQTFATIEIPLNDTVEYSMIRIYGMDAFTVYYAPSLFIDEIYVYGGESYVGGNCTKAEGTFVSASTQHGIVDVDCGFKPDLLMVSLPLGVGVNDTVSYWEKDMSFAENNAVWCLQPAEGSSYTVALGRVDGETGIQAINDDGFSFMSNAWSTQGVTCRYVAIKY
jgi:hypothetical protein